MFEYVEARIFLLFLVCVCSFLFPRFNEHSLLAVICILNCKVSLTFDHLSLEVVKKRVESCFSFLFYLFSQINLNLFKKPFAIFHSEQFFFVPFLERLLGKVSIAQVFNLLLKLLRGRPIVLQFLELFWRLSIFGKHTVKHSNHDRVFIVAALLIAILFGNHFTLLTLTQANKSYRLSLMLRSRKQSFNLFFFLRFTQIFL
jgi:hypothetical protein